MKRTQLSDFRCPNCHKLLAKFNGPWLRQNKSKLRSFFPATERIIFAEHYGAEGFAKGCSGYATKCSELRKTVFNPLIDYFRRAKESLGVSSAEINGATNTKNVFALVWIIPVAIALRSSIQAATVSV